MFDAWFAQMLRAGTRVGLKGAMLGKVDLLDRYAETYFHLGAHMAQSLPEDILHAKRESRRLTQKLGRKVFDVRTWADAYGSAWPGG